VESPQPDLTDTAHEDVELLQRQVIIQRKLIKLAKENGLAFYRPHYYQHLFHASTAKRRGAFTGNRFGKSHMDAAETAAWMRGERTWYKAEFDIWGVEIVGGVRKVILKGHHDGGENHPLVRSNIPPYPTKQLVVCANWDKVDEIWTSQMADRPGKIWQFLPKGWAKGFTNHAGVISEIHGANGSLLTFMSVDAFSHNKLVAESSDFDRVVFDEPAPQDLWKGVSRGLVDRGGQADFALTSLQELWIFEKFNQDPDAPVDPDNRPFRDRYSYRASMLDNPHLTDQNISDFSDDLTEDERQCRIHGIPLELSGRVYKEFNPEIHVLKEVPTDWKDFALPAKTCVLYCRVDTHPVKPHAVMFAAVGPSEIPIVCHEFYESCDADTLCEKINAYVSLTGCFLAGLKVEPAAWIADPATKKASIASYFFKHGLFPVKATKDLETGIIVTRAALKNKRVLFTPNCKRTLWEFTRYRFDPKTGKPIDVDDHMMENLYRLLISPCRWFDPDKSAGFPIPDEAIVNADLSTNY
jgi:hypothetical protein